MESVGGDIIVSDSTLLIATCSLCNYEQKNTMMSRNWQRLRQVRRGQVGEIGKIVVIWRNLCRILQILIEQMPQDRDYSNHAHRPVSNRDLFSTFNQGPTSFGEVADVVNMAKSPSPACRVQGASQLLKLVEDNLDEKEMQEAGAVNALMDLLRDKIVGCRIDALLALHHLSRRMTIQTTGMPLEVILPFLGLELGNNIRVAAVGLLEVMVKENAAASAKKFMETPKALTAVLYCFDRDAENPVSQACASALLRMATEEDTDDVRVGIANADLSVLVKFVRNHGTVEHKELLTTMLALLCRNATVFEKAVINAEGLTFMLKSLQENIARRAAAQQDLPSLRSNSKTQGDVLQAGFVEIAMGSTNQKFASTEVALALADICSIPAGLEKIVVACPRSVGALLQLLKFCPTIEGKAAAAVVIATLFNRLSSHEDFALQVEMTEACSHLLTYIAQEDQHDQQSQVKVFLKALTVFATESEGRKRIHEERGEETLMPFLRSTSDTEVRDLVLRIFAEMSNGFREGLSRGESIYQNILGAFLKHKIGKLLCRLSDNDDFRRRPATMKTVVLLMKNLSFAGRVACAHLSENGAVPILLYVFRRHNSSLSPVTTLAARALLNLIGDPIGKQDFFSCDGIKNFVSVLKVEPRSSDVDFVATRVLTSVAKDPKTGKDACKVIFNCGLLTALTTIMDKSESSKSKWQAARLANLLARNGPTQKVCVAMREAGTLYVVLNYLRFEPDCRETAEGLLKFVKGKNVDCKRYIDSMSRRSE